MTLYSGWNWTPSAPRQYVDSDQDSDHESCGVQLRSFPDAVSHYSVVTVQTGWFHDGMPRIIYGGDFQCLVHDYEVRSEQYSARLAHYG